MLEKEMLEQLKSVFTKLENSVELVVDNASHEDQAKLSEMLTALASTSDKISVRTSGKQVSVPEFHIEYNGAPNGISFKGIPGGHEFSSLILAILNSDGKGKFPDELIQARIKKLKGNIALKTYISLTCENCPDVVQNLNLMAIINPNLSHQMVDGGYVQEEIESLRIQGVPSVMNGDKLVSSGKIQLVDLIAKLEKEFGVDDSAEIGPVNKDLGEYDVVVIGGGPAGASSAIYSVRKGLRTAIIAERIGGQVQDTKGIENLISVPYTEGPQLSAQLATHLNEYPVKVLEHRRVKNIANDNFKFIELDSGETLKTKSIIVATGAKWRQLGIPGEKEYIGRGVAFCPHCDGPYYKGKDIAVVGGGNSGVEAAIDLAGIVKSVTLFEFMPELKADKVLVDKLRSLPNVTILANARTSEVVGDGNKVIGLEYEDRATGEMKKLDLDGIFVQIGLVPNSDFIKDLVETNRFGEIVVDVKNRTNVPQIYAAGDVTTTPYKQIIIAMGEGAKAALTAFEDLMLK
ncbi:alkyl hydroperoxide reductase, F subunit [Bacteriovorax sp. BSW11_IV]|uniref:alkyl hydroperoxide reductase subunit F n=1 Tax=Bacteriovorax sp. BSW11_IV TaxID=1353529 RepID=UPI00038A408E|nr:alkyl hydroperoxide reductase subunit F [Bacteriovorax sp. BSW11_IV]EQC48633.1 alkyl hydroperoxide reductase, F subunit [Bacteriovorax sp. BSW11_IV]